MIKFQLIITLHDPKEILVTTILHIASLSMKNTLLMNMGLLLFNTKSKKNEKHIVNEHGVAFVQYKEQKEYDR
jgi:hypothetical protein